MAQFFECDICTKVVRHGLPRPLRIEWDTNAQKHVQQYDLCRECGYRLEELNGRVAYNGHGILVVLKDALLKIPE